ncbi:MAG: hypothetical protein JETT_3838 [Candidatus Jettenia ecosi]|uniref:Uncharacterized protein n=1 Tax=Candidatus Jettenia ecosi TaxID=2494326 RepID=A0A533Q5S3_9BACT|nr:MAG: hypothetical protein JETT_3838 [Candidatus Jettenia ecosi]
MWKIVISFIYNCGRWDLLPKSCKQGSALLQDLGYTKTKMFFTIIVPSV